MRKAICLCLSILMIVCVCAGCSRNSMKETKPSIVGTTEPTSGKMDITDKNEKITFENVSPYSGKYLENDDGETVSGIYAVKFTNHGDQTIQNAEFAFSDGTQELYFRLEMLPAGQSVVVAEQNRLAATGNELLYVDGYITYMEAGLTNKDCVKVADNHNGTVKIENMTDEMLPLIRVFFRPTDKNGNMLGGPCKNIMVDGIEAGTAVDVPAEGWDETCVVVTVLVINE